ncbi:MAG: DUF6503 family protein [Nitritalea sp.]
MKRQFAFSLGVGLVISFLLGACTAVDPAQRAVDRAILAHGGERFKEVEIAFQFRDREYTIFKSPEGFRYTRSFRDSLGAVQDVLDNTGFTRFIAGEAVELTEKDRVAFTNSVNSVAYFAFLPYGLNDPAVIKTYEGEVQFGDASYERVRVAFQEEGGGEDFEDVFLYWFDRVTGEIAYLAYSFHTNGGGVRFREVIHRHDVGGLILLDYANYKPADPATPLEELEALFLAGELEMLSEIRMEEVRVEPKREDPYAS